MSGIVPPTLSWPRYQWEKGMQTTPVTQNFSSLSEYRTALSLVVAEALGRIRIFDHDMREGGWNSAERYSQLRRFLLRDTRNRLEIVVQRTEYVQAECPRLLTILREFSYAVFIHQTEAEAQTVYDPFLIADGAHYVHRFHHEHARGEYVLHDLDKTQSLVQRFAEIWRASHLAIPATTLGL